MIFFGALIGIGVVVLVIAILVWINSGLIGWILNPLDIAAPFEAERKRERRLRRFALFGGMLGYFGIAILGPVYLIGWLRHLKTPRPPREGGQEVRVGIIPQFSLADLLTLVFSLGFFPIIMQQLLGVNARQGNEAAVFLSAAAGFPAFFVCGLYRTEIHRAPRGWKRTAFLALVPYLFCATPALVTSPFMLLGSRLGGQNPFVYLVFNLAVVVASRVLAHAVRDRISARESEQKAQTERARAEDSWAPNPADASALNPESVQDSGGASVD